MRVRGTVLCNSKSKETSLTWVGVNKEAVLSGARDNFTLMFLHLRIKTYFNIKNPCSKVHMVLKQ